MKPVAVKYNTYIDFYKESNKMDPKFKVGYYIRISKYKNIFTKGSLRMYLWLKQLKMQYHEHMLLRWYKCKNLFLKKKSEFKKMLLHNDIY